MNVVMVPAWKRPGFLFHTLNLFVQNYGFQDLYYMLVLDHGYDPTCRVVFDSFVSKFGLAHEVLLIQDQGYTIAKQSFALITGYRRFLDIPNADLLYMVEDDVFVANDFFLYHAEVYRQQPMLWCSIGTRNNNSKDPTIADHTGYYLKYNDEYQSLGVCWSKPSLQLTLEHIKDDYFRNPLDYCNKHYPNSNIGPMYIEQDGLLRRIKAKHFPNTPVAYPHIPRGYHAGFQGKNRRGKRLIEDHLTLEQRIAIIEQTCFSVETMRAAVLHPEHLADSTPVSLTMPLWLELKEIPLK